MGRLGGKISTAIVTVIVGLSLAACASSAATNGSAAGSRPATHAASTSANTRPATSDSPATPAAQLPSAPVAGSAATACDLVSTAVAAQEMGVSTAYPSVTNSTNQDSVCSFGNHPGLHKSTIVFETELSCGAYGAGQWAFYSKGATPTPGGQNVVFSQGTTHDRSQFEQVGHGCTFSALVSIDALTGGYGSTSALTQIMLGVHNAAVNVTSGLPLADRHQRD